jgi:hypothetical protein
MPDQPNAYNRDTGEPVQPLGYDTSEPDFEVYHPDRDAPGYHWQAYVGDRLIECGDARTRIGLAVALWRAKRFIAKQQRTEGTTDA